MTTKKLLIIKDTHAEIPLTKGAVAMVSLEDVDLLNRNHWHLQSAGYAACRRRTVSGQKSMILLMHREVMREALQRSPAGHYVDHINGNRLDNRRQNLRVVSPAQSAVNKHSEIVRRRKNPGHRGVCYAPELNRGNPWMAYITKAGKRQHLGYHATAELAAATYRSAAIRIHGEFSNFHAKNNRT